MYLPFGVSNQRALVLRTSTSDPLAGIPAVRSALRDLDPTIPLSQVTTFERTLARVLWQQRLQGQVAGVFALLALGMATVGIYGVISYGVSQRTRELGIRAAIGASRRELVGLVVGEGGRLALWGIGLGLVAAVLFTRLLSTLLYGVGALDPAAFVGSPLVIGVVALLASGIPGLRAGRVDPAAALRE